MDSFDIIWIIICIGLPIISGIASSLQKVKKGQKIRPKERNTMKGFSDASPITFPADIQDDFNVEDVFEKSDVVGGDKDFLSNVSDKHEPIVPAPSTHSYAIKKQNARKQAPKAQNVKKTPKAPILIEDNEKENKEEDIELRKMIIYSIIMEPKFKE